MLIRPFHVDYMSHILNASLHPEVKPQKKHTNPFVQVAKSLSRLASVLNDMERYEEAESAYRESLSIKEDALGETNVQVHRRILFHP